MVKHLQAFFKHDIAGSAYLLIATMLAMVFANTPFLDTIYHHILNIHIAIHVGTIISINKSLLHWVNDGLMAIFFLLVGLELKREYLHGELSNKEQVILPAISALGGIIMPALIYIAFNYQDHLAIKGWTIPAATDIAFALSVLALLKDKLPASLKVFLLALAILDDLAAILIIAFFYTDELSVVHLILATILLGVLILFNRLHIKRITPYMVVGVLLWFCVLQSGIHATLAGVALAFTIPFKTHNKHTTVSPVYKLEGHLHAPVSFVILPLFAFVNAGLALNIEQLHNAFNPIPLGVLLGLFIGKQLGVFFFALAAIKLGLAKLPTGANWMQMYGLALLCGIGFTMSLFIGSLAFGDVEPDYMMTERIGIILGSLISAITGYSVLRYSLRTKAAVLAKKGIA